MTGARAKVLTVSDGVVAGTRNDDSGPALAATLADAGFEVIEVRVCPDGIESVSRELIAMSRDFTGVIVTTGGTGFSPRDLTPEATRLVVEREAPGLAEAMRAVSPLGRLSRGIAGITHNCIILNTPGSPRGCVEQLGAVIDVLGHAVALLDRNAPGAPDHPR